MSQGDGLIGEKLARSASRRSWALARMGVVYRGTNEKTGKAAAIKVMSSDFGQKGTIGHRFDREAEILQQLRHPNIVRFLAWGRFRGTSYIAMEYVQGETVEKMITDRGHLPWREVVELGIQICEAPSATPHEHGVVHRDLKPSNLMVTADGKVKLADFGIAKDLDATALTATGRTLGTAAYMSPSRFAARRPSATRPIFTHSGWCYIRCWWASRPLRGRRRWCLMHCHLNEPPPRPSAKLAEIPRKLDDLVVVLMAKSPTDRPWDSVAVVRQVDRAAQEGRATALSSRDGLAIAEQCRAAGQPAPRRHTR